MVLLDIPNLPSIQPWREGEKIPWDDPAFSRRMLREHLSQDHPMASRRFAKIDRHVSFIHRVVLEGRSAKVLDLGCGPGLYLSRLSALGHESVGIDFSPASVEYARSEGCQVLEGDVRRLPFGEGYDLAMMLFGEFNVFHPEDVRRILKKARQCLRQGGRLLLEPHTLAEVKLWGERPSSWYSALSGLFADDPYLMLEQSLWDEPTRTATTRMLLIDAGTAQVTRYGSTMQAYTDDEYVALLEECGFSDVELYPSLVGEDDPEQPGLLAIVAKG